MRSVVTDEILIETISNHVPRDYMPDVAKLIEVRADLRVALESYALSDEQIREVFAILSRGIPWSKERFIRFIEKHLSDDVWTSPDTLYPGLEFQSLLPKKDALTEILGNIYRRRSAASHEGRPYPAYVAIGSSPWISNDALRALEAAAESERLPPLRWFERVVHDSLFRFVTSLD